MPPGHAWLQAGERAAGSSRQATKKFREGGAARQRAACSEAAAAAEAAAHAEAQAEARRGALLKAAEAKG